MANKQYNPVQQIGAVIFRFISKNDNEVFKLVTKSFNTKTAEIIEGDTLISEAQAVHFAKSLGIEIKDLGAKQELSELSYQEYLDQEAELDAELARKEAEKNKKE